MSGSVPLIVWGAPTARLRGPVVAGMNAGTARNAIGVHGSGYGVYQGLAVAAGELAQAHLPNLVHTGPSTRIGPHRQWFDPTRIVSFDPWGHLVASEFAAERQAGMDIRPSIAVTAGHLRMPEIEAAMQRRTLHADGRILDRSGSVRVTKIAIEAVWWLPGIAARLGVDPQRLREKLCECTGGMYPDLLARPECSVFLPPIGGCSVYLLGDPEKLDVPGTAIACRMHDECSGSDVFGSDLCTCRPYLAFAMEEAIRMAQSGGIGILVYHRKEGRALGEVVKLLVYNARAATGDLAEAYFNRTEHVAGVQDLRCHALSVDVLHWLGVRRVDRWISMSHLKSAAVQAAGIAIIEQIALPQSVIPISAQVEMQAKKAAGYYAGAIS